MKKYIIAITSFVMLCGISSCSKSFLDETPLSSSAPQNILVDSAGFQTAIIGIYNQYSNFYTYSGHQGFPSVWVVGTDIANATTDGKEGIEIPYYNYGQLTSSDNAASYTWNMFYTMINLANTVIDYAEAPNKLTVTAKNWYEAEAKFFRAYSYNYLATLFGKVPLVTHAVTSAKVDFVRNSLDSVNALIVSDLQTATSDLPDVDALPNAFKSRVSKYVAMQLLAEVYLRIGKYDLAEQQTQAIINSGRFSLVNKRYGVVSTLPGDCYSDMFHYGNQRRLQGNTEAIWVLEQENPSQVAGGNTDNAQQRRVWGAAYYLIPGMKIADSLGGRGIARLRLSNWVLYGLYSKNDIRNSEWNIRRHYYYNDPANANYGKPVPFTGPDTLRNICPSTMKWGQYDSNDEFGYAMIKDFILMRLGETYLLQAEAQFREGKLADAAASINVLRQRAFADYPAEGQVNASDITLDFILDERARELVGEENRRMTLMRTGTLVDRAVRLNSNDAAQPITGLAGSGTKFLLMPIPLSEIQLNSGATLEQNPGYSN